VERNTDMPLELIIIRQPQGVSEVVLRKSFGEEGGTIGRAEGNSWILPDEDRYVSSYHARIEFDGEAFYVIDVSTNGIYLNDFASVSRASDIEMLSAKIAEGSFVITGFAKHDWEAYGMDLAYRLYKYSQSTGIAYGYLGGSLQLSQSAAMTAISQADSALRNILTNYVEEKFDNAIQSLTDILFNSYGVALIGFAFLLRFLFMPIQLAETRSRLFRKLNIEYPELRSRLPFLRSKLKIRTSVEFLGGLVTLLLILPIFQLLNRPESPVQGQVFLWTDNLGQADVGWAVLAGLLLIALPGLMTLKRKGSFDSRWIILGVGFVCGIALLYFFVPASVCVYICAVALWNSIVGFFSKKKLLTDIEHYTELIESSVWTRRVDQQLVPFQALGHEDCGLKATRLAQLSRCKSPLITVPESYVIKHNVGGDEAFPDLDYLIASTTYGRNTKWAVRSCSFSEDGNDSSEAGQYHSELNLNCGSLNEGLRKVFKSYKIQLSETDVSHPVASEPVAEEQYAIVQTMIQPDYAGVIFSRSPDNAKLAMVEYVDGLADKLLSGLTEPSVATIGRVTGEIVVDDSARLDLIQHVFSAAIAIEDFFGSPQDIEWAYVEDSKSLYILQSRSVTACTQSETLAKEQNRLMELALSFEQIEKSDGIWKSSEVQSVAANPSPFTASLLTRLYHQQGSLDSALKGLGFTNESANAPDVVFGKLYDRRRKIKLKAMKDVIVRSWWRYRLRNSDFVSSMVAEIDLKADASILSMSDETETCKDIAASLMIEIEKLTAEIYKPVFEVDLLLSCCPRANEGAPMVATRFTALCEDLAELVDESQVQSFVEKWGHRSEDDYELSKPSFGEYSSQVLLRYACQFSPTQHNYVQPDIGSDSYAQLVALKERCKDRAIIWLRHLKPVFMTLGKALKLQNPIEIFNLSLNDLSAIAEGRMDGNDVIALIRERNVDEYDEIELPNIISLHNIEILGKTTYEEPTLTDGTSYRGRMLSSRVPFAGTVCSSLSELKTIQQGKRILLVAELRPNLVAMLDHCDGMITEIGGELSHAAIIARERKVPVVKLDNARRFIKPGVNVNISKHGTIEVLNEVLQNEIIKAFKADINGRTNDELIDRPKNGLVDKTTKERSDEEYIT